MANILEYTLSLNDKLSSKLQRIGITNNQQLETWSRVQTQINAANQTMTRMGLSVGSLKQRIEALKAQREWIPARNREAIRASNLEVKKLEAELNKLNNINGGRLKGWFEDLKSAVPALNILTNPLTLVAGGLFKLTQYINESSQAYKEKAQEETKLAQVMRNTMGARDKDIQSVKEMASAQQKLGVIDDGLQAAGAQELATYLTKTSSIEKLLPVMNDMLAQQYGLNASSEQAINIGSMLGKVMDGQTGALSRYGYKFDEAQAKILKTGTEAQRAAVLFDVVSSSVGGVNKALAATPEGRMKQLQNNIGGVQEDIGKLVVFFQTAFSSVTQTMLSSLSNIATWFDTYKDKIYVVIQAIAKVLGAAFSLVINVITGVINMFSWMYQKFNEGNPIMIAVTGTLTGIAAAAMYFKLQTLYVTIQTALWAKAQWLLNLALSANPVALIIAGIVALIAIIGYVIYKTDGWGNAWKHTVNAMKLVFAAYIESIKFYWNTAVNAIMIGINVIKLGWYEFKEAVGMGDSDENKSILAKIHGDIEARKKAIVDGGKAIAKLGLEATQEFVKAGQSLRWNNDRSLGSITSGLIDKLGIAPPKTLGAVGTGSDSGDGGDDKSKMNQAIANGGTKHNYTTINLKDLIGVLNIQGRDFKDSANQMAEQTQDELIRVLAMSTTAGG